LAAAVRPEVAAGSDLPAPGSNDTAVGMGDDRMPPPVPEPFITGQIPIVGAQPLVSPMPSSNEEARSMWHEAERADEQAAMANDDTLPMDPTPAAAGPVDGDMVSAAVSNDDESTPADGLRIGGEELA
jgi:hypothetical protein